MSARRVSSSEADLVRQIQRVADLKGRASPQIPLSIGDDAAALRNRRGMLTLLSVDALVEGVHFNLSYFTPEDLGWKALAVNLSDIAAMGGTPRCFAASIAIPKAQNQQFVRRLYLGMMKLAARFKVALVGGDTCASPQGVFVDIAIVGEVKPMDLVKRSGARAGDALFVTGRLGGSAMGLELLTSRRPRTRFHLDLVRRHFRPVPRCEVGGFLAHRHLASAMIDLSDGLSTDLHRLCEASHVGAIVDVAAIPIASETVKKVLSLKKAPLDYAINGGEDYELLFTVPSRLKRKIPRSVEGTLLNEIGVITEEAGKCWLRDQGHLEKLCPGGFDHFAAY